MEHIATSLFLIPFFPLLGALLLGLFHIFTCTKQPVVSEKVYTVLACIGPMLSFFLSIGIFWSVNKLPVDSRFITQKLFNWIVVGDLHINMGFFADPLSILFLLFVTFIGTFIHIYSIGYMAGEENYGKYFSYLNFFLASMLILVLGDGPVVMFIGWEGVGLCSYLLISFYSKKKENVLAGNKAFIVNRIGDIGFVLGISVLFWGVHTSLAGSAFDFLNLRAHAGDLGLYATAVVCLLFFIGACGKSAQIPLYVWLPDAMAGPTPVSALIHAATMVTAGVYMVARFSFLYASVPVIGTIVAWTGILTALLAALIACFQRDIKKILAYSTVSQLGYMFVGVGIAVYSAGIFHVFTHAFFKALLFLGAGSVIYALNHQQDIWKMGGLRKKLPQTHLLMLVGALALAGFPPFAGFFSKDEILVFALAKEYFYIWLIGIIVTGITAYYTFRMFFLVFWGDPREQKSYEQAREPSFVMMFPLIILAVGAALAGFLNLSALFNGQSMLGNWLAPSLLDQKNHISHNLELFVTGVSIFIVLAGIFIAYKKFAAEKAEEEKQRVFGRWCEHKFYIDELYHTVFVKPYLAVGRSISCFWESRVVDLPVKMVTRLYETCGRMFKVFQSGYLRFYAIYMVIGLSLMSIFLYQSL